MVCCPDHHDLVHFVKSIHFCEDLIDCWSVGRMLGSISSRFGQQRVYFIDENNARLVDSSGFEQLLNSSSPDSYNHFVKLWSRAVDKVDPTFPSNCSCEESFSDSRVSKQEHPFGNFRTLDPVFVRMLYLSNQVVYLFCDFVNSFDVRKLCGFVLDHLEVHRLNGSWFLEDLFVQVMHGHNQKVNTSHHPGNFENKADNLSEPFIRGFWLVCEFELFFVQIYLSILNI